MPPLKNSRHERFAQAWFSGKTYEESAIESGYKPSRARQTGSFLVTNRNILARYNELQEAAASARVMSKRERMERLSEIARARLTDFMELGQDGSWVNIGEETPHGAAIAEIHSRTEYDDNGAHPTVHTSVKLHDPLKAIDLLNKMDKLYSDGANINIDNRRLEVNITPDLSKLSTEELRTLESILSKTAIPAGSQD